MVAHPLYEGIRCEIIAKGNPLEEYEAENDKSKHPDGKIADHGNASTITKYIESISGEPFKIKVAVNKIHQLESPSLLFCAFVDGENVDGLVLTQLAFAIYGEEWSESFDGAVIGHTLRPFVFSKISISKKEHPSHPRSMINLLTASDDKPVEETKKLKERLSNVGDIVVKVYRQDNGGQADFEENTHFREADFNTDISEEALKGKVGDVSHGTSLGPAMPIQGAARWLATSIDAMDKPIAIFCFKYRSKGNKCFLPARHQIEISANLRGLQKRWKRYSIEQIRPQML